MTKDEIQTGLLRVCKVANWDGDFNVVGFHALCNALVELGAAAEREACAVIAFNAKTYIEAAEAIRARGQQ
jgi:hypothetical protein